jgi:uncharacterized protein YdhG (YjbR/CyaY superfamily)
MMPPALRGSREDVHCGAEPVTSGGRVRVSSHLDGEPPAAENRAMSSGEIDTYLEALDEPKRTTLQTLRQTICEIVPDVEECISYGMPAFRRKGKVIAGFAAFRNHLSYLPHSGRVLAQLPGDLAGYVTSKGALQFPIDQPLPKELVKKLIAVRLEEVSQR